VVTSDIFGTTLQENRIVMVHDCHYIEVNYTDSHLVLAKVAGFDSVVFGIEDTDVKPILFEHPEIPMLIATTKLSQFVTGRYAPKQAWQMILNKILAYLQPDLNLPELQWQETVRPTYPENIEMSVNARKEAVDRGISWYHNSKLLMHDSWIDRFDSNERYLGDDSAVRCSDMISGDGSNGIYECFGSFIRYDGSQPII
jgi:hypothetical protein